jgi:hypothetical protein
MAENPLIRRANSTHVSHVAKAPPPPQMKAFTNKCQALPPSTANGDERSVSRSGRTALNEKAGLEVSGSTSRYGKEQFLRLMPEFRQNTSCLHSASFVPSNSHWLTSVTLQRLHADNLKLKIYNQHGQIFITLSGTSCNEFKTLEKQIMCKIKMQQTSRRWELHTKTLVGKPEVNGSYSRHVHTWVTQQWLQTNNHARNCIGI